jgi:acyl-coenzyme A synthetase/AMP-(fatty) acid ligase
LLVQEFLKKAADRLPDKIAPDVDGKRLTYAQVEANANRLARALREYTVQRGDRMDDFVVPRFVEFYRELPRTDSGKNHKTGLQ